MCCAGCWRFCSPPYTGGRSRWLSVYTAEDVHRSTEFGLPRKSLISRDRGSAVGMDAELLCWLPRNYEMLIRIRTTGLRQSRNETATMPTFVEARPHDTKRALSFLSSLAIHVAAVCLIDSTVQAVRAQRALIHSEYPMRALAVPVTPIFWPKRLPEGGRTGSPAPPTPTGKAPAGGSAGESGESGVAGEQVPAPAHPEKRFRLPIMADRKAERQILVRMEIPADLKLKTTFAVPEVLLWQLPAPRKPEPEIVKAAHKEEQPVHERETPAVRPQLVARNEEPEIAELRHAAHPPVPVPTMPLPLTNTTPIRVLGGVKGNQFPNSTGSTVAEPQEIHVISVPELPVPHPQMIVLPTGNQGTPPVAGSGGGMLGTGGGTGGELKGRGASSVAGGSGSTSDSGSMIGGVKGGGSAIGSRDNSSNGNGPRGGSSSFDAGFGGAGGVRESGAGANGAKDGTNGNSPLPPGTIRIVRPKDGKYNVVVLGSSNLDAYPEANGLLSGKLVYTVYIRAGGRKEWILQYCLPKAVEQMVKLRGSAEPIDAPYPFIVYHPNLALLNDPDYLIVHGFITAAGRFEHLSAIGDIDSTSRQVLIGVLERWEFRPASRDGEPIAVEIALIIPRDPT